MPGRASSGCGEGPKWRDFANAVSVIRIWGYIVAFPWKWYLLGTERAAFLEVLW
jgi:hypothetical protein